MVIEPSLPPDGVNVTEQEPLVSVQVDAEKVPEREAEKLTVPVGVTAPAPFVSVTVAVQVVA